MAVDLQHPFGGTTCYERAQHGVAPALVTGMAVAARSH